MKHSNPQPLHKQISQSLEEYFSNLDGNLSTGLYKLVIDQVEKPLIEAAMNYVQGNQSKAAKLLGISRNTLRKRISSLQITEIKPSVV